MSPELLAPAGDLTRLKTALRYGADAVYLGGEQFSLRAAAVNFSEEELSEGLLFAHERGKKVYAALNILPHNADLDKMDDFIRRLYALGVDAVIVADLGVMERVRRLAPNLPIHISTQASATNYATVEAYHRLGAERVILARELSLSEIAEIREKTTVDLEVFCHGAMCMAYSGRCLLSSYFVSRDSNLGQCAQPCRWQYYVMEEKRPGLHLPIVETERGSFIFNAKDLCMIEHVDDLIKSGVSSVKIEGRIKTAYYVATVVKAYRQAIDAYEKNPENWYDPALLSELEKVSHRQYDTGFFYGRPEQIYTEGSYIRPYDVVATVDAFDPSSGYATLSLLNKFSEGDVLEIMEPEGPFWVQEVRGLKTVDGTAIESANHAQMKVLLRMDRAISSDAFLRKKRQDA